MSAVARVPDCVRLAPGQTSWTAHSDPAHDPGLGRHRATGRAALHLHSLLSPLHACQLPLAVGSLALWLHRLPAGARADRVRVQRQEDVAAAAGIHTCADRGLVVELESRTTVGLCLGMRTADALTKLTSQTEVHDADERCVLWHATVDAGMRRNEPRATVGTEDHDHRLWRIIAVVLLPGIDAPGRVPFTCDEAEKHIEGIRGCQIKRLWQGTIVRRWSGLYAAGLTNMRVCGAGQGLGQAWPGRCRSTARFQPRTLVRCLPLGCLDVPTELMGQGIVTGRLCVGLVYGVAR